MFGQLTQFPLSWELTDIRVLFGHSKPQLHSNSVATLWHAMNTQITVLQRYFAMLGKRNHLADPTGGLAFVCFSAAINLEYHKLSHSCFTFQPSSVSLM
jgi:hypothetical protein